MPVTAAMRPLMVADPILRAGNPEIVPASYLKGCCCAMPAHIDSNANYGFGGLTGCAGGFGTFFCCAGGSACFCGDGTAGAPGILNSESSMGMLASIFWNVIFASELGSPLGPVSTENG